MWPDWTGETVAIVASGESANLEKLDRLKGAAKVVAIKKSFELVPFADVVYGCDGPWWRSVQFLPKFNGLKLAYEPTVCNAETGVRKIEIKDKLCDKLLFDQLGSVGSGGNSGFQALNLVAQFGARRILLIGFDMQGEHWYGRNNWHMCSNPGHWNFPRWVRAFERAQSQLAERGVEVINTSFISQLRCFKRVKLQDVLELHAA